MDISPSMPAVSTCWLLELKVACRTLLPWRRMELRTVGRPVRASQTRAVPSRDAVKINCHQG
jgi:hypothetical protein